MEKDLAIIIDLEGTLSDHMHRYKYYQDKNYDKYNKLFFKDAVNMDFVAILEKIITDTPSISIILCTAKDIAYRAEVTQWLQTKLRAASPIVHQYITKNKSYYRDGLDSRPSQLVKRDMLHALLQNYDIISAYDDKSSNCDMFRSCSIKTHQVCIESDPLPARLLGEARSTFTEKNEEYGECYMRHGNIMAAFFPDGICLKTPADFLKYHIFELDIIKSNRLASSKFNHKDSWRDKIVYAAMGEGVTDYE